MTIRCATCGKPHDDGELPEIGLDAPDPYLAVPKDEREERTFFTLDRCIVRTGDDVDFFIRGVLPLPLIGQGDEFCIGLWVTQSEKNFDLYSTYALVAPTYGWISNRLPHYARDTYGLKARVHPQARGIRPRFELEATDHPLAVEQRTGITVQRAWEILHRCLPN